MAEYVNNFSRLRQWNEDQGIPGITVGSGGPAVPAFSLQIFRSRAPPHNIKAHDAIMALRTNEAPLLPVVGAAMHVILHAFRDCEPATNGGCVEKTIEIDPFPAVHGPWPAAPGFPDAGGMNGLFDEP
jgi:hypothetical protein